MLSTQLQSRISPWRITDPAGQVQRCSLDTGATLLQRAKSLATSKRKQDMIFLTYLKSTGAKGKGELDFSMPDWGRPGSNKLAIVQSRLAGVPRPPLKGQLNKTLKTKSGQCVPSSCCENTSSPHTPHHHLLDWFQNSQM